MLTKFLWVIVFLPLWLFLLPQVISAQVVINEFSSNSNPEWVEILNLGSSPVDLNGWKLVDSANHVETLSGSIGAGSYFVYERSDGWLNNSGGDSVLLKDTSDVIRDSITYGQSQSVVSTPDADKSAGRVPDGSANWVVNLSWTKGSANPSPTTTPTPSPVPTNTPTPEPTNSPTPSPTSTPTLTPTVTPTPKPTLSITPTGAEDSISLENSLMREADPENVLAFSETFAEGQLSPTLGISETSGGQSGKSIPFLAGVFIVSGLGLVGYTIYSFWKGSEGVNDKNGQNEKDNDQINS